MIYENRTHPPLNRKAFALRMLWHVLLALAFVAVSLAIGMAGYAYFEHEDIRHWQDAFLNAAMLLGGMGPIYAPKTNGGKIFAGLYALYAGLGFLVVAALLLTPILHRLLHRFHWEESLDKSSRRSGGGAAK